MVISAGISTDMNPELSIGNLLQMFKTAGMLTPATTGMSSNGEGGENSNAFLQLLQKNMASLLKSDQSGSPELLIKQGLTKALENLTQEDQIATNEILNGLACLSVEGKMAGLVSESAHSHESLSAFVTALGISDNSNIDPTVGKPYIAERISVPGAVVNPDIDATTGKTNVTPQISDPARFDNSNIDPTVGKPYIAGRISIPGAVVNPDIDATTGKTNVTPQISDAARFDNSNIDPTVGKPYIAERISIPGAVVNPDIDATTGKTTVMPQISDPARFDNSNIDPTVGKPYIAGRISVPGAVVNPDIDATTGKTNVTPQISDAARFDSNIDPTVGKPYIECSGSRSQSRYRCDNRKNKCHDRSLWASLTSPKGSVFREP